MFYIGSNVLNWPLQAQRGLADLHEIGIHTCVFSHMSVDEATAMLTGSFLQMEPQILHGPDK